MPKLTFHNLGNADCIRIDLSNDKKILFDYANRKDSCNDDDLRCDLPVELRDDLGDCTNYDVVAFTHLDSDHYAGSTDFFYFDHIAKYQPDVDGEPRIKMDTMWVPAAVITEQLPSDALTEAKAIQKEARERFKAGKNIRVFSHPTMLADWCESNGVDLDERHDIITDAGQVVPEFSLEEDGAEFFVHSPFAMRQDEDTVVERNRSALAMHLTLRVDGVDTKVLLASDVDHGILTDIVNVTEARENGDRLEWDIHKLSHHCSYKSLGPDKGDEKTDPMPKVKRLFEHYGQPGAILVSSSDTIPAKGDERDLQEHANPPHRQAANYYKQDVVHPDVKDGDFIVTMEHPTESRPKPLVIKVDSAKATVVKTHAVGAVAAVSSVAPKAG